MKTQTMAGTLALWVLSMQSGLAQSVEDLAQRVFKNPMIDRKPLDK